MADSYTSDSDQTTRTLLQRVLDTADLRTPRRRRRSAQTKHSAQRTLLQTPSSKRQNSQTKTSARRHSHGARSGGRLARVQARGHLEEPTPRTLLKNILLTAPESSIVMPDSVVKPVQVPEVLRRSSRRKSSWGSLELQLPELEPSSTLAPGLMAPGKRKQKLRLSVFQREVSQGLPLSQEPPGNADDSSLTSSFSFVPPVQPQSVERPGLARRRPMRRPLDVHALLQDLEDDSSTSALPGCQQKVWPRLKVDLPTSKIWVLDWRDGSEVKSTVCSFRGPDFNSQQPHGGSQPSMRSGALFWHAGDNCRTPVATLPTDVLLEDTQPFSQPVAGSSLSMHHSLPNPSHTGAEDAQRAGSRTRSTGPRLQSHMNRTSMDTTPLPFSEPQPQPLELREAVGSQEAVEAKVQEGSSGDKDTFGRPASPELAFTTHDLLPEEQPHQFLEPPLPPGVAALSSEPQEPMPAKLPIRTGTAGPRHRPDPYKAGLSHYMKLFSFYTKMPVEKKALELVEKCLDKYFQHLFNDLEAFAAHAGRKTVKPEDLELLMRRQGLVTDQVSLHVLVERYLPLEYRQLLIPCAFSGNSVFPAQ
ncbi:centromere protein T isoform X2 [Meriones unguiculatus]|uniref:centromere protein T isoform X2 n=1 Tax=Meriones unguiculatus TaxID=10047 RepID=UPI00293EEEBC|nr:centromere protein T isoform X2 [Meriones unguiculatus]